MKDEQQTGIDGVDRLVDRVVTGDAEPREWDTLLAQADREPRMWREIVHSFRDDAMLGVLARRAGSVAERVGVGGGSRPADAAPQWRPRWSSITGWALAAMLFLAWVVGVRLPTPQSGVDGPPHVQTAGFPSAQQAFDAYLKQGKEEGRVLSAEPRQVIVRTRPDPDGGGVEVIFIRQVMERTVVPDLFEYRGEDEHGRPTLARYETPVRRAM